MNLISIDKIFIRSKAPEQRNEHFLLFYFVIYTNLQCENNLSCRIKLHEPWAMLGKLRHVFPFDTPFCSETIYFFMLLFFFSSHSCARSFTSTWLTIWLGACTLLLLYFAFRSHSVVRRFALASFIISFDNFSLFFFLLFHSLASISVSMASFRSSVGSLLNWLQWQPVYCYYELFILHLSIEIVSLTFLSLSHFLTLPIELCFASIE